MVGFGRGRGTGGERVARMAGVAEVEGRGEGGGGGGGLKAGGVVSGCSFSTK